MADYKVMTDWVLSKEGGLSRAQTDEARKYVAPCTITYKGVTASDWHTNKGVTYPTFKNLASSLLYSATCDNFANMPTEIWNKIFKYYWNIYNLDNFKSQAIANLLVQSAWGNGTAGSLSIWNKFFKTSKTKNADITDHIKELLSNGANESKLFNDMADFRLNWMLSIPNSAPNHEGWKKRTASLKELSAPYLTKEAGSLNFANIGIAGLLLFGAWKLGEKIAEK